MIEISIIVVTYNSASAIEGLLSSLENFPPRRTWELVVTDNASGDDSVGVIRRRFADTSLARNEINRGFAAGVNDAAQRAVGRLMLLANPDVTWTEGAIDQLADFLDAHDQAAAVTPRLAFPDGSPQPSTRRFPTHSNILFSRGTPWGRHWAGPGGPWTYTLPDPDRAAKVDAASGAFLLLRRDAFIQVGTMDEGYFLYVEDTDLCRRLWDAGWEVWIEPAVEVRHEWGGYRKHSPTLRNYHRDGIRKYFEKHHSQKRIRNAVLTLALNIAALLPQSKKAGTRS